jgi:putative ABC transport system substrate-binding protein
MRTIKSFQSASGAALVVIAMVFTTASLACGQPSSARIAVLTPGLGLSQVHEALQEGLARFNYTQDKNITFTVEDTKGNSSDLAPQAAKLLSAQPAVLFAVSTAHAQAAKQATLTVPIVFAWVGDPIQAGLIAGYPYSKTNLTGVAAIGDSLSGKRLEMLLEVVPKAKTLLILVATKESISVSSFRALEEAAKKFGVKLIRHDVANGEEIKKALEETPKGSVDAIFHVPSTLVRSNIALLVQKAKRDRIPLDVHEDALLEQGALLSYGPNPRLVGLQAATLVNKILKGTKPGEIRVETPERFFLAFNRATAKEIGLNIPRGILERADRLVQ